jgi:hypothetical protein
MFGIPFASLKGDLNGFCGFRSAEETNSSISLFRFGIFSTCSLEVDCCVAG